MSKYSIAQVNQMSNAEFVAAFGGVYECSEWIAQKVWSSRVFESYSDLLDSFRAVLAVSPKESKLALLKAHPELAGKAAQAGKLTKESEQEQASVGLNSLSPEEMTRVEQYNTLYQSAFGFPFIIAVKNHTKHEIFEQMAVRVKNCVDDEFATALSQVNDIAQIRLDDLVIKA